MALHLILAACWSLLIALRQCVICDSFSAPRQFRKVTRRTSSCATVNRYLVRPSTSCNNDADNVEPASQIGTIENQHESPDEWPVRSSGPWTHRRQFFHTSAASLAGLTLTSSALSVSTRPATAIDTADNVNLLPDGSVTRAIRPTAYRVDSTIPPTLLPVPTARAQLAVLRDLGKGLGTDKKAVFIDRLNLNNMLQKAVYGTADAIGSLGKGFSNTTTQAPASFVCFGLPMHPTAKDVDLTISLLQSMWGLSSSRPPTRKNAIGIAIFPYTAQGALSDFVAGRLSLNQLRDTLLELQVSVDEWNLYEPLLDLAARNKITLLALGVTSSDQSLVRKEGLQSVDPNVRAFYVVDPEGFIATTTDPSYQLYTDRSLLKDYPENDKTTTTGKYFAERILVHEAAATMVAQYAVQSGVGTVVAIVAPVNDVRYLKGINGRLPRVYQHVATSTTTISNVDAATARAAAEFPVSLNDVTTILVNPTSPDTLSRTVRLRLEIGTGPETLEYQTKIADYLWFSSSPTVSLLPRVMDY
jgi:Haem-binding uptake, Tiki superfamily, ChaN